MHGEIFAFLIATKKNLSWSASLVDCLHLFASSQRPNSWQQTSGIFKGRRQVIANDLSASWAGFINPLNKELNVKESTLEPVQLVFFPSTEKLTDQSKVRKGS